jgi:hypothetical protein
MLTDARQVKASEDLGAPLREEETWDSLIQQRLQLMLQEAAARAAALQVCCFTAALLLLYYCVVG